MIVSGTLAKWSGCRPLRVPGRSRDNLTDLLRLLESAARILGEAELLRATHLELTDWDGEPGDETLTVAVAADFVTPVLERIGSRLPWSIKVHGRAVIREPTGVDYVLDDVVVLEGAHIGEHEIALRTSCDAWLPHDLLGAPQPERYALNAPRLVTALARLEEALGVQLADFDPDYKYAVVRGHELTNLRYSSGNILVPDYVEDAAGGEYCTLLLDGRAVAMGPRLRAGAGDEVRSGYLTARHEARVLITFTQGHAESHEALERRLGLRFPGIAPLRWLGENESNGIPYADVLIEDLPAGRPASELAPLPEAQMARLGAACAEVLAAVHADGQVAGIRPELIYVDDTGAFAALAPRGPAFIASAPQRAPGLRSYATPYDGYEVLALGKPAGASGDVFALCATLHQLVTGQHPFGAAWPEILARVSANRPDPYPGAPRLGALLARGLDPDPARRPTASELAAALREG